MAELDVAHRLAASRGLLVEEDVDLIQEAVRTLLPKGKHALVVDLGAGSGTTALSVFTARDEGIDVLTVDQSAIALASTEEAITLSGYRHLWTPLQCKSWEGPDMLPIPWASLRRPFIDLLLVDAGHHEEEVDADLHAWLPLVRPGAPVWCHDWLDGVMPDGGNTWPDVQIVVNRYIAEGLLEPIKTGGWGWLGRRGAIL